MGAVVTAGDVLEALEGRWPSSEYLKVREAPQSSDRTGRKIDLLVVSLWRSRGLERDAVEVKVSMSDWKRELDNPEKADWWWQHSHRFWVAAPVDVAPKIKPQLPSTWGLLSIGDKVRVLVPAPKHVPEPLSWVTTVGVMRASADCGPGALMRAEQNGYAAGLKQGRSEGDGKRQAEYARDELARLNDRITEWQKATGIDIRRGWHRDDAERFRLAELIRKDHRGFGPAGVADELERSAKAIAGRAEDVRRLAGAFREIGKPEEPVE